ncbi:MAG TPA: malate dehydrogenase, partial [Polaribacter sp.]|nr:malate dehydrogenase [Polaribacter sp.]
CDTKKIFPCSTLLEGEYGLNDLCIGVPVVLGKNGIESIVEMNLSAAEKAHMVASATGVSKTNSLLEL